MRERVRCGGTGVVLPSFDRHACSSTTIYHLTKPLAQYGFRKTERKPESSILALVLVRLTRILIVPNSLKFSTSYGKPCYITQYVMPNKFISQFKPTQLNIR